MKKGVDRGKVAFTAVLEMMKVEWSNFKAGDHSRLSSSPAVKSAATTMRPPPSCVLSPHPDNGGFSQFKPIEIPTYTGSEKKKGPSMAGEMEGVIAAPEKPSQQTHA